MSKLRRNLTTVLAAACLVAAGAALAPMRATVSPLAGAQEEFRFAYIPHLTGHPVWLQAKDGWDAAAEQFGFRGDWVGSTTGDTLELVTALDAQIAQQVDGIAIAAIDPSAMTTSIDRAVDAGIPVVTILADAPDSQRNAFLGSDVTRIGTLAAQALQEATGGTGKVGVVMASLEVENQRQILDAFTAELAKTPDLTIVATEADNSDLALSAQKIAAMLTANPDLAGIFGINANVPIAACQVFKERGVAGKVAMVGMDDLDESLACVRDGTITGVIAQNFYGAGFLPGEALLRLKNGESVPAFVNTGVELVTTANIDTYKAAQQAVQSLDATPTAGQ